MILGLGEKLAGKEVGDRIIRPCSLLKVICFYSEVMRVIKIFWGRYKRIITSGTVNCSKFPSSQRKYKLIYSVVFMVSFGGQVEKIKVYKIMKAGDHHIVQFVLLEFRKKRTLGRL